MTVWRNDNTEPFGANPPDENPSGLGAFEFPMRFPGQYYDRETNLHYNYYRDYDPSIGGYKESDPIGLHGGNNTYGYVQNNPIDLRDPFGLMTVVESGFPKEEGVLRELGERMQQRIRELCPESQGILQPIFDRWVVSVDPKIRSLRRNRGTYADTDFKNQSTVFNSTFFDLHPYLRPGGNPTQGLTLRHEFRHLMRENNDLFDANSYLRETTRGDTSKLPFEIDADAFARKFMEDNCLCRR